MFGSFLPSLLVGSHHQSLLGAGSRHCYGINYTNNRPRGSGGPDWDSQLVKSPVNNRYHSAQVNPFESRSAMGTGRLLMLISETLAVVAVATQFFLPTGMGISLT